MTGLAGNATGGSGSDDPFRRFRVEHPHAADEHGVAHPVGSFVARLEQPRNAYVRCETLFFASGRMAPEGEQVLMMIELFKQWLLRSQYER